MNPVTPARPAPKTIAVVGVGAIGSTFAYRLARAGHDVTVIARADSARLASLLRDRAIVLKTGERAAVRVASAIDERFPYDLVLVTVLDHQVDAVLPALARSGALAVQFMFNTFEPERLSSEVGIQRCSFGMQFVMARLDADGRLTSKISAAQKTLHGDPRWVELFEQAGMPSRHEAAMPLWLRSHAPMCVSMESICVAAERRGVGANRAEAMIVARGLVAGFETVRSSGSRLHPASKAVLSSLPVPLLAGMLWLVSRIPSFRTLLATGLLECRALIDDMAAAALRTSPPSTSAAARLLAMKPAERSTIDPDPYDRSPPR